MRAFMAAQVVLAHQAGDVAGVGQRLRKIAELFDRRPTRQFRLARQGHMNSGLRRHKAGKQACACGRTHSACGEGIAEQHPGPSQPVDVGRGNFAVAIGPEQARGLVVGNDQDNIRTLSRGRFGCRDARLRGNRKDCQTGKDHRESQTLTHAPGEYPQVSRVRKDTPWERGRPALDEGGTPSFPGEFPARQRSGARIVGRFLTGAR